MLILKVGTAGKRYNSTAVPFLKNKKTMSAMLKEETSIENPVFIVSQNTEDIDLYNYCSLEINGRTYYYWLTDRTFVGGTWELTAKRDVGAQYRDTIGNSFQTISRCADKDYIDSAIVDTLCKPTYISYKTNTLPFLSDTDFSDPTYIVRTQGMRFCLSDTPMNADVNTFGGLCIALNSDYFSKFIKGVQGAVSAPNVTCSWTMSDFIKEIYVLPWNILTFKEIVTSDQYAFFNYVRIDNSLTEWKANPSDNVGNPLPVAGALLKQGAVMNVDLLADNYISKHIQRSEYRSWLLGDAGTKYFLNWSPCGQIEIPAEMLREKRKLRFSFDFTNNSGAISILNASGTEVLWSTAVNGLGISYSAVSSDRQFEGLRYLNGVISAVSSLAGSASAISGIGANVMSGNVSGAVGGSLEILGTAGMSAVSASAVTTSVIGGVSDWSNMKLLPNPVVVTASQCFSFPKEEKFGYPSNKRVQIKQMSGIIFCETAEIYGENIIAKDLQEIRSFMIGGFYYE